MERAVTRVLSQLHAGEARAGELLLPMVYRELRQLAAARLRSERTGHTLQATALVHEAYLRLMPVGGRPAGHFISRAHFFAAASEAMRRILVECARRKRRQKRGADFVRCEMNLDEIPQPEGAPDLLAINEALSALECEHADVAVVVKLRYFVGLTIAECGDALGVSHATIERRWRYARAWLARWFMDRT